MLQLIIDAYEEKSKDENFFKRLKKMDKLSQIFCVIMIAGLVLGVIFLLFKKIVWSICTLISWVIIIIIFCFIITAKWRKKWKENVQNYNEKLDRLKEVLIEVNYYSKNRIEKLIVQCEKSIHDLIVHKEKGSEKRNRFIDRFILPIVAFAAGALSKTTDPTELIALCILAIIIIVILNWYIYVFGIFVEDLLGNELEKRKYLLEKLEDLLMRDFEITN